jgi:hypothetical protein
MLKGYYRAINRIILTALAASLFAPILTHGLPSTENSEAVIRENMPADDLLTIDPRTAQFLIKAGEGSGKTVTMSIEPSKRKDLWTLRFEGLYKIDLYRSSGGTVQVSRIELLERNKAITFNPPIELIPAAITAGVQIHTSGRAEVFNLDTGEKTYAGSFSHTVENLSRTNFATPAGRIEGYLILYESRIDLDNATIRIDLESGWSAGKKLVYWRTRSAVEKLLFFGDSTTRELVIAE